MKDSNHLTFELRANDISAIATAKSRNQRVQISRNAKKDDRQFRPWNCAFTDCRKPE